MKAIQYTAAREFSVVELEKPVPGPHQVVIRVKACGICKTDLTIHDAVSYTHLTLPTILLV